MFWVRQSRIEARGSAVSLLAALLLLSCGDGDDGPPGSDMDGGSTIDSDAARVDAGGTDAASEEDAGAGRDGAVVRPPPTPACDLVPVDPACTADETCDIVSGSDRCRPVGDKLQGETCGGPNACGDGLHCSDSIGRSRAQRMCRRLCGDHGDCQEGAGSRCAPAFNEPTVDVCSVHCNPVTGDGCPDGMGCTIRPTPTGGFHTECHRAGLGRNGDACSDIVDCATGFTCGGMAQCTPWCRVGNDGPCPGSMRCVSYRTPLQIGAANYGTCL